MFGFTNDDRKYREVCQWRKDAVADGWSIRPTYGDREPVESAATLSREGWRASVLARVKKPGDKWKYEASVAVWSPSGRSTKTGIVYDWGRLQTEALRCDSCGEVVAEVHPVAFANKACAGCLPEMRRKLEQPGWNA